MIPRPSAKNRFFDPEDDHPGSDAGHRSTPHEPSKYHENPGIRPPDPQHNRPALIHICGGVKFLITTKTALNLLSARKHPKTDFFGADGHFAESITFSLVGKNKKHKVRLKAPGVLFNFAFGFGPKNRFPCELREHLSKGY